MRRWRIVNNFKVCIFENANANGLISDESLFGEVSLPNLSCEFMRRYVYLEVLSPNELASMAVAACLLEVVFHAKLVYPQMPSVQQYSTENKYNRTRRVTRKFCFLFVSLLQIECTRIGSLARCLYELVITWVVETSLTSTDTSCCENINTDSILVDNIFGLDVWQM